MNPTPAEKAIIGELRRIAGQAYGTTSQLPFSDLIAAQRRAYWQMARWHLNKLNECREDSHQITRSTVEPLITTLRQIAALPRGGRAKRLAVATLRFMENVK